VDPAALGLKGYRIENGLLWPDYDRRCAEVTFRETAETVARVRAMPSRRVCVQAGGNCGQLVRELAGLFEAVYTFEPDPQNFVALSVNTADCPNVFRFQAALGDDATRGVLRGMANGDDRHPDDNCGALFMSGRGLIPTLEIDDLALTAVDLIMLDIEGGELAALRGARRTICTSNPLVIFESKGLGAKFYGEQASGPEEYLSRMHHYRVRERLKIDTVMEPSA
jgi:FkbM family methyltransferase